MSETPPKVLRRGVVILAAGRSTRMGRPKMLLPWAEGSVIAHLVSTWLRLPVRQIAVVCAEDDLPLQTELNRIRFPAANWIFNPAPERGMFSSIQCAARWSGWQPQLTHWAIALGDQPHLSLETLARLLRFASERQEQVCQPALEGHPCHPVILAKARFLEIAQSQRGTFKEFLAAHSPALCEINDPGLGFDMDRPEDYERLRQMQQGEDVR